MVRNIERRSDQVTSYKTLRFYVSLLSHLVDKDIYIEEVYNGGVLTLITENIPLTIIHCNVQIAEYPVHSEKIATDYQNLLRGGVNPVIIIFPCIRGGISCQS